LSDKSEQALSAAMMFANRKLLRFPVVILLHIAAVAGLFKLVYPEVEINSLTTVIAGIGLCLAFATDFLYTKIAAWKKKKGEEANESD
jgi:protein-S-isoprenylcysteine O-methyltransferase Ste14